MRDTEERNPSSPRRKLFHGYWILAVAFLYLFMFSGCGVGVFSLFVQPLQSQFGWGRGEIMFAFTIYFLLVGLAAPFIGSLIDRYGVRKVTVIGATVVGIGFASLSQLQSLWHYYGAYLFIGAGMATVGQVPASTLVANWFQKRRGTAIGVMSVGIGAGILVLAPLLGGCIIPQFGWRNAYLALAVFIWLLVPLTLLVVRTRPQEMGLYPDGVEAPEHNLLPTSISTTSQGLSLKMALGTSVFWLMGISFFINGYGSMGVTQSQVPHLQDIGFPLSQASSALTGLGIGSAIGKFVFGWLCDKIHAKYACAISLFLLGMGTFMLLGIDAQSSMAFIWCYAIIYGLGNGGWLPTMSMLVNINFGLASYGAILGMVNMVQSTGCAIGPLFAGYMFDTLGTYRLPFTVFLASYIPGIIAILVTRRPRQYRPAK